MTRDFRSSSMILMSRLRDASSNRWVMSGWRADSMKNNQNKTITVPSLTAARLPRPLHSVFVRLQRSLWPTHKEPAQEHSANESPDVRPPRDAAYLLRTSQSERATE